MNAFDERLGRLLRLIRGKAGLTQVALAKASGVPVDEIGRIENGDVGAIRVERVRKVFAAVGGQARLSAWWNGAAADRLIDEKHAVLGERGAAVYHDRRWQTAFEVTFNEYGERGSVDLLAGFEPLRAVAINEIKTAIGSLEKTNRSLDVKERLAPKIAFARFGWKPEVVGRILILPNERTRRVIERHSTTMDSIYPARSREVRAWLRNPATPIRGIWFVSDPPITKPGGAPEAQDVTDPALVPYLAQLGRSTAKSSGYFVYLTQHG